MIRYALRCGDGHGFESWFQSASAFDALKAGGHLECPVCGGADVTKAMMAPRVAAEPTAPPPAGPTATPRPVAGPELPAEIRQALDGLRKAVEDNSDYVGRRFASEARKMHRGDAPVRAIHGEANAAEARALIEDGVPVVPLPFRDRRGTN